MIDSSLVIITPLLHQFYLNLSPSVKDLILFPPCVFVKHFVTCFLKVLSNKVFIVVLSIIIIIIINIIIIIIIIEAKYSTANPFLNSLHHRSCRIQAKVH